jgi:hypothetical protein
MRIHSSERACLYAFIAGYAVLLIQQDDAIHPSQSIGRTYLSAFRVLALAANNGHSDYRLGIGHQYSYRGFFGIVNTKLLNSTYQLAYSAAGTLLWNNS